MTFKEYKEKVARREEIRSANAELQAKLAKENRGMTDEEREMFKHSKAEDDALALDCSIYESERAQEHANRMGERSVEDSADVNIARMFRSIVSGKGIPEDLNQLRDADGHFRFAYNKADAQLRDGAAIQQAASAKNITPIYIQDYIKELTPQTIIGQLGARIQSGISGQWNYPTVKGLKATWYGENDAVTGQTIELGVKTIAPHRLPIRVDISRRTINQTAGAIRDIVVDTMRTKHALALNEAFVATSAAANAPTGPLAGISVGNTVAASGDVNTITRANLLDLRSRVNGSGNVPVNEPAFLMGWKAYAALANLDVSQSKSTGRFVLDLTTNSIDGVPVVASSLVPDGVIYYGNFGYAMVGQFGAMTMDIDTSSVNVLSTNTIAIVINSEWDFFTPYQEAFGKITFTTAGK